MLSTISPKSTKQSLISHLKEVSTVMVNNSININKTNNNVSPKVIFFKVMVNNSTNINTTNNNLSHKESLSSDGQQFDLYEENKK